MIDLLGGHRRIHLLGIGGAGMSGIAEVLTAMGHEVSGSDQHDGPAVGRLRELGVQIFIGHRPEHVVGAEIVGVSSAIRSDNIEYQAAVTAGVRVHPRADLLAAIAAQRPTLSVTGTHGKTTTSALTVAAATGAGFDPSFIIGGRVDPYGSGARWAEGNWFVLEADESDSSFLVPPRVGGIVTNLEADHLDHHGTFEALRAAFEQFVVETDGPVLVCADDVGANKLAALGPHVTTYGTDAAADLAIGQVRVTDRGSSWMISAANWQAAVSVGVPGLHVVRNATAAVGVVVASGGDPLTAAAGIGTYRGVGRRFEARGEARGVTFIDDYAHLPAEINATMTAAHDAQRTRGWRRIVAVVQPHRYSRTVATAADYVDLFDPRDVVVVTDVYAAGESPIDGVTGRLLVDAICRSSSAPTVHWVERRDEVAAALADLLEPGDLCLTLGAGDVTSLPDEVIARMAEPAS